MAGYLGRRLLQALGVLWAAYTVSFLVLYALPADPVRLLAGGDATDVTGAQLDELRAEYGLDQPLVVQYLVQLGQVLRGNLGTSIVTGRPVTQILGEAIPPTAQIAAVGFALAVVFGGCACTSRRRRGRRRTRPRARTRRLRSAPSAGSPRRGSA